MSGVPFIYKKMCMNCGQYNDKQMNHCIKCGHLMTHEASCQEEKEYYARLQEAKIKGQNYIS